MARFLIVVILSFISLNVLDSASAQNLNSSTAVSSQELLPSSTKAWLSIPDSTALDEKFLQTQIGQLTQNPELEPFIESLKTQFNQWMRDKNLRLGVDLENIEDVRTGEVCIAGILPPGNPAKANNGKDLGRGVHGLVLLVDVSENVEAAQELLGEMNDELTKRGATKENYESLFGAEISKWKFAKKGRLKKDRFAYHTIIGGWMLASDNENIFRRVVRRLANIDSLSKGETLSAQPAFQAVMTETQTERVTPQIRWFINPFGYIQLARAIAEEEREFKQRNNDDWARILKKIGFDGFQGVGGNIAFATGKHEILHKTYVYKPILNGQDPKQQQVFGLFDFTNQKKTSLLPPEFVPNTASGCFIGCWNMQKALKNVGYAIDTFARKENTFSQTLASLKVEMNVDVVDVISKFDNELIVISDSALPVEQNSERIVIAIRLLGDKDYVMENIKRSWPHQFNLIEHKGFQIVQIDDSPTDEDLDLDLENDPFAGPDEFNLEDDEEEDSSTFNVFQERYCVANDEFLFVANNLDYLKLVLDESAKSPLSTSNDFERVADSLNDLTDGTRISFRNFGRMDKLIRPNYEMMRAGKMAASDTILARLLNHSFQSRNPDADKQRVQQIDGSKLPSDFDKQIAPYFGPAGWVMETTEKGWLFTGVLLERQDIQVVRKEDATSQHK